MIRLFVAARLPDDVRTRLNGLEHGLPGARWVPPENLHLTLRFIGEVPEPEAAEIDGALGEIRSPGFDIMLDGVDCFGDRRKARTLWVGVVKNQELGRLYESIERAVVRAGQPPDNRKFTPHVTLARLRDVPRRRLRDYLEANAPFRAGPVPVRNFTLFASYLSQAGAIHEALSDYPLEGG